MDISNYTDDNIPYTTVNDIDNLVAKVLKDKGTESLLFFGPKIWDILPDTYRDMPDLNSFKVDLKKWRPAN